MRFPLTVCLLLSAVLLAGCSSSSRPPSADAEPPDVSTVGAPVLPPPDLGDDPPSGGGTDRPAVPGGWSKAGVTGEEKRADIDACYRFATAQVARDIRIDSDIEAARDPYNSFDYRFGNLTRQVDGYYYSKQRINKFGECMRAKGYVSG